MADIVQLKENGVVKYMKTHADAIDGVEGKLVKAVGNETILGTKNFQDGLKVGNKALDTNMVEQLLNVGKQVWSGAAFLHAEQTLTPSIPLSECLTGWLMCYQPYDSETDKVQLWETNYGFIPKTHGKDLSGVAVVHNLKTLGGGVYNKYVYVTNTTIKGHKTNTDTSKYFVATKIYAI
ncbi:TPA: hypothetical protein ACWL7Y_002513 [Enterococcus faecalis]